MSILHHSPEPQAEDITSFGEMSGLEGLKDLSGKDGLTRRELLSLGELDSSLLPELTRQFHLLEMDEMQIFGGDARHSTPPTDIDAGNKTDTPQGSEASSSGCSSGSSSRESSASSFSSTSATSSASDMDPWFSANPLPPHNESPCPEQLVEKPKLARTVTFSPTLTQIIPPAPRRSASTPLLSKAFHGFRHHFGSPTMNSSPRQASISSPTLVSGPWEGLADHSTRIAPSPMSSPSLAFVESPQFESPQPEQFSSSPKGTPPLPPAAARASIKHLVTRLRERSSSSFAPSKPSIADSDSTEDDEEEELWGCRGLNEGLGFSFNSGSHPAGITDEELEVVASEWSTLPKSKLLTFPTTRPDLSIAPVADVLPSPTPRSSPHSPLLTPPHSPPNCSPDAPALDDLESMIQELEQMIVDVQGRQGSASKARMSKTYSSYAVDLLELYSGIGNDETTRRRSFIKVLQRVSMTFDEVLPLNLARNDSSSDPSLKRRGVADLVAFHGLDGIETHS